MTVISSDNVAGLPPVWFDQFTKLEPDGWVSQQWCWRHWAPCPVLDANGVLAALYVMTEFTAGASSAAEANAAISPEHGKMCCRLGDAVMYKIWGQCPPEGP
jgi:hypothetical protein